MACGCPFLLPVSSYGHLLYVCVLIPSSYKDLSDWVHPSDLSLPFTSLKALRFHRATFWGAGEGSQHMHWGETQLSSYTREHVSQERGKGSSLMKARRTWSRCKVWPDQERLQKFPEQVSSKCIESNGLESAGHGGG